jgi:hypothetical protein
MLRDGSILPKRSWDIFDELWSVSTNPTYFGLVHQGLSNLSLIQPSPRILHPAAGCTNLVLQGEFRTLGGTSACCGAQWAHRSTNDMFQQENPPKNRYGSYGSPILSEFLWIFSGTSVQDSHQPSCSLLWSSPGEDQPVTKKLEPQVCVSSAHFHGIPFFSLSEYPWNFGAP